MIKQANINGPDFEYIFTLKMVVMLAAHVGYVSMYIGFKRFVSSEL